MENRFLILLPYFERPNLVKNALNSILKANEYYDNWVLAFIDDGSKRPVRDIVENILGGIKDYHKKVHYYNTEMTPEDKLSKGCYVGQYLNMAMMTLKSDISVILNDDDELVPDCLYNLNLFFLGNPNVMSCWSKVHIYNPYFEKSENVNNVVGPYNNWVGAIEPFNRVEGCQIAWRTKCFSDHKVMFEAPCTGNHDAFFVKKLYEKTGPCVPSGIISQYKAMHSKQLSRRAFKPSAKWCLDGSKAWTTSSESSDEQGEIQTYVESSSLHAYEAYKEGDLTQSLKIIKNSLKKVPENSELYFTLGILLATINPTEGLEALTQALQFSHKDKNYIKQIIEQVQKHEQNGTRLKITYEGTNIYGKALKECV